MNFNQRYGYEDRHAFLSASQYHWINYDDERLAERYKIHDAKEKGTRLHALAAECIRMNVKLDSSKTTLNLFVNDAIGYRMNPEQLLYYSELCFGTADAISFRKNLLRIHDLKTGKTKASFSQLHVYAALFCLEYDYKPSDIKIELRIYQNDHVLIESPDPKEIRRIQEKIVRNDKLLNKLIAEGV